MEFLVQSLLLYQKLVLKTRKLMFIIILASSNTHTSIEALILKKTIIFLGLNNQQSL